MDLTIDYLKNHPEHVPTLAQWMFTTWGHYNPDSSLEKAQLKLKDHLNENRLPLAFIALVGSEPVGLCCLRENDGIRPDLAPWLGSLFVKPAYRGQRIGEQLIDVVKRKARKLGYLELYLLAFDQTLPAWYEKLGWELLGEDYLFGHRVSVMSCHNED